MCLIFIDTFRSPFRTTHADQATIPERQLYNRCERARESQDLAGQRRGTWIENDPEILGNAARAALRRVK